MELYRLILYIIFGLLPSLAWLFYYLQKDLHTEPKKMILKVFLLGSLITIPVFFIQMALSSLLEPLQKLAFFTGYPILLEIIKWFIIIAFIEEFFKYFVVRITVMHSWTLDEPLDIMLYMVVAALGFAAVENMLYLFLPAGGGSFNIFVQTTAAVSFIRFVGATFLHTLCSGMVGYFLALASLNLESRNARPKSFSGLSSKFGLKMRNNFQAEPLAKPENSITFSSSKFGKNTSKAFRDSGFLRNRKKVPLAIAGIFLATLLHGLYNFSIMTLSSPWHNIVPAAILISLAIFMLYDFDEIKKVKGICKI